MQMSLHVVQGNARRVAGKKGPAKLPARISVLPPALQLGLNYPNTERSDQFMNARRGMRHHPPALDEPTHHRVTDNEKFPR
jgi:hypothetical protein